MVTTRIQILIAAVVAFSLTAALAQDCGPKADNRVCNDKDCCSSTGWCGQSKEDCASQTCFPEFSGPKSECVSKREKSSGGSSAKRWAITMAQFGIGVNQFEVPDIDQCGTSNGITCPGAGKDGYFYRCCSSSGHCGPKNDIQNQALYCGSGCQSGFGDCSANVTVPSRPATPPRILSVGSKCGPIVNARCGSGLCCSGSNFCGTGKDYCGADNWCQPQYGRCD